MSSTDPPIRPSTATMANGTRNQEGSSVPSAPSGFAPIAERRLLDEPASSRPNSTRKIGAIGANPIGALATLLPSWFLVPFAIVAVLGLIGGSVLDIYSSGLAMLSLGIPIPRYAAALLDGTVMTLGSIYVVFGAHNFIAQFQGFL